MNGKEKQLGNEPADRFEEAEFNPNGWTKRIAGLTKREYFAGLAVQGMIGSDSYESSSIADISAYAKDMADALIAELSKEGGIAMDREQIEQAACEYANVHYRLGSDDEPAALIAKYAFVAGAESRQAEIDNLKIGIAMAQDMISELQNHSK